MAVFLKMWQSEGLRMSDEFHICTLMMNLWIIMYLKLT